MRFPVFVLGLVVSSLAVAVLVWLSGASVGTSLLWAVLAFLAGQVLYVVLIGLLARKARKPSMRAGSKTEDAASVPIIRRPLAARNDQQG